MQTFPDYLYAKPESCVKTTTNPRYKFFRQNYFTAGDYEQFLEYWDPTPHCQTVSSHETLDILLPKAKLEWSSYRRPCVHDVLNTYMYIAEKFKKGIFIQCHDRALKTFLPFSKVHFVNEWYQKIHFDRKKYGSIQELMKFIAEQDGRPFVESRIHKDSKAWYGNNGLVRLEFPISEGDSGCNMIKNMMDSCCIERHIPDCNFFVNKRDFPLLRMDGMESYTSFFGNNVKLVSHAYSTYLPILSMTTTDKHADIPIPTWDDWCRVSYWYDKRLFGKDYRTYPLPEEFEAISWKSKIPTAVFRGASTGLGTTERNNPRLFFSKESFLQKKDIDGYLFLNAGITKWNLRPRKHPDSPYLETIHIQQLGIPLVEPMTPLEQAHYKYILHLPGHSCAYRLSLELFSGSVVLLYPCEYKLWYMDWLQPWVHYIPINPKDPKDIYKKIKWCKRNDETCRTIAENAKLFANRYLSRKGILDYLEGLLNAMVRIHGIVEYASTNLDTLLDKKMIHLLEEGNRCLRTSYMKPIYSLIFSRMSLQESNLSIPPLLFHEWRLQKENWYETMEKTLLVETRNTNVSLLTWYGHSLILKTSKKSWKQNHHTEYGFYVLYANLFAQLIPNFISMYDSIDTPSSTMLVGQYVEGISFDTFLQSPSTTLDDVIIIWLQLCLALQYAQHQCGFLHMDLYPWNIILRSLPCMTTFSYPMTNTTAMSIMTDLVPIMIDFEKSHFVHEGIHFYNTSPFQYCRIHDIISLVFSSLHIFIENHQILDNTLSRIIHIMNFFQSHYTQHHRFHSLSHVKIFLKKHKKFSNMMKDPKTGLENVSIMDFFHHVCHLVPSFSCTIATTETETSFGLIDNISRRVDILKQELDVLDTFYVKDDSISLEEKKVTLRRYWLYVDKSLTSISLPNHSIQSIYSNVFHMRCIEYMKTRYSRIEDDLHIHIWEHMSYADFTCPKNYQDDVKRIFEKWKPSLSQLDLQKEKCPLLTSHLCKTCLSQHLQELTRKQSQTAFSMKECRQLISLVAMYQPSILRNETIDLFTLWYHGFPLDFLSFLSIGL